MLSSAGAHFMRRVNESVFAWIYQAGKSLDGFATIIAVR